jgi:5-methylcytosine-specific restriction endonuclease McrA
MIRSEIRSRIANLAIACRSCNSSKSDKTEEEFRNDKIRNTL